jgi:hypothetical protein
MMILQGLRTNFYEKRGKSQGDELEDWLEAEQIVMEKRERHTSEIKQEVDAVKF